jgi:hypothetical protein
LNSLFYGERVEGKGVKFERREKKPPPREN